MDVGTRIKTLREDKKMTQKELAQLLNVKQTAVSYWETGKREPDLDTIKAICTIFEVTYNKLLDDNWENYIEEVLEDFNENPMGTSSVPFVDYNSSFDYSFKKRIVSYYNMLNDLGKKKVDEYIKDLIDTKKYHHKESKKEDE